MTQFSFDDESSEYFGGGPVLHQLPPWQATRGDDTGDYIRKLEQQNKILNHICDQQEAEIRRLRLYIQQLTAAIEDK